jgi:8-amino-7-oxononanoate synthase
MTEQESLEFIGTNEVRLGRRTLLYFSGCDYLRLARHPGLVQAAVASLRKNGLSVAASRRTTGNHKIYRELEAALTKFFDAESALVLPDGYFAPIAAAQALAGEYTHVLVDELAHGALFDAARMFHRPVKQFQHRNPADLARHLTKCGRRSRPIILTDGLYGHNGSVAPLREYLKILPRNGLVLVDDAHGAGILGATGKGSLEHEGVGRQRIVQCATLSKAFGSYGGVVLGPGKLRAAIVERSRSFAGTTALPPPLAGAAIEAVRILKREPLRRKRLAQNLAYVQKQLCSAGWDVPETPGPMVRLPALTDAENNELRSRLLAAEFIRHF